MKNLHLQSKKVIPRSRKFLSLHSSYYMRLEVYRRHKKPIFKIVVTNQRNRIVACLGYYNPFEISLKTTYTSLIFNSLKGKTLGIDVVAAARWLKKDIIISPLLGLLLEAMGLLKINMGVDEGEGSANFLHSFYVVRADAYRSLNFSSNPGTR